MKHCAQKQADSNRRQFLQAFLSTASVGVTAQAGIEVFVCRPTVRVSARLKEGGHIIIYQLPSGKLVYGMKGCPLSIQERHSSSVRS